MFYKNLAYSEKTFYGITFKPGEVKEVPGFINDQYVIAVDAPKSTPKVAEPELTEPAVPKKEEKKSEQKKNSEDLTKEKKIN